MASVSRRMKESRGVELENWNFVQIGTWFSKTLDSRPYARLKQKGTSKNTVVRRFTWNCSTSELEPDSKQEDGSKIGTLVMAVRIDANRLGDN